MFLKYAGIKEKIKIILSLCHQVISRNRIKTASGYYTSDDINCQSLQYKKSKMATAEMAGGGGNVNRTQT
ncbi:MAG: hypothetical protein HQK59_02425 [Deltaproteobacteria bacterium]|nr:hypothetical protein [Deltaproteobacteria bacterium]